GTPAYIAPEVLRGAKAGPATDIWALGVVLFEMLTGRLPFQGRTLIETCTAILNEDPPKLPDRVPPGLRSIVQRCLSKSPAHRYRSAGEGAGALEAVDSDSGQRAVSLPGSRARGARALVWIGAIVFLLSLLAVLYVARDRILGGGPSRAGTIRSLAV